MLSLTAAGRKALEADMAGRDAWLAEALDGLTGTEAGVLVLARQ